VKGSECSLQSRLQSCGLKLLQLAYDSGLASLNAPLWLAYNTVAHVLTQHKNLSKIWFYYALSTKQLYSSSKLTVSYGLKYLWQVMAVASGSISPHTCLFRLQTYHICCITTYTQPFTHPDIQMTDKITCCFQKGYRTHHPFQLVAWEVQ